MLCDHPDVVAPVHAATCAILGDDACGLHIDPVSDRAFLSRSGSLRNVLSPLVPRGFHVLDPTEATWHSLLALPHTRQQQGEFCSRLASSQFFINADHRLTSSYLHLDNGYPDLPVYICGLRGTPEAHHVFFYSPACQVIPTPPAQRLVPLTVGHADQ